MSLLPIVSLNTFLSMNETELSYCSALFIQLFLSSSVFALMK